MEKGVCCYFFCLNLLYNGSLGLLPAMYLRTHLTASIYRRFRPTKVKTVTCLASVPVFE